MSKVKILSKAIQQEQGADRLAEDMRLSWQGSKIRIVNSNWPIDSEPSSLSEMSRAMQMEATMPMEMTSIWKMVQ